MWQQDSQLKSILIKSLSGSAARKGKVSNSTYLMMSENLEHVRPLNRELTHWRDADRKYGV